jgi:hypothetical protein
MRSAREGFLRQISGLIASVSLPYGLISIVNIMIRDVDEFKKQEQERVRKSVKETFDIKAFQAQMN